jgi:hypothetical protein
MVRAGRFSVAPGKFEPRYQPEASFEGDFQFALRYEGVNLEVLELLFAQSGPQPLAAWLRAQPESSYGRRAAFLYEWITGRELDIRARARLRDEIDWPAQSLDLFINIVRQGGGKLSQTKRKSQFALLTDEEIARFVPMVNEAFEVGPESGQDPSDGM